MTTIKLLSAGLIATVMFTVPADAHGNSLTQRYVATKGDASVFSTGRWAYGNARIPTPQVGKFATPRARAPGGVCDVGDNGMIC